MITEKQYRELKQEVENAKSQAERAQGALDQLMARLEEEFECKTVKEAKELLASLNTKKQRAEAAFTEAVEAYETKWKQHD